MTKIKYQLCEKIYAIKKLFLANISSFGILLLFLILATVPGPRALAFSASYIMPDQEFMNGGAMNAQQIQDFLVAKGSFLASYHTPADAAVGPSGAIIPAGTLASTVIYQAVQWYGVSPQVIITTLQKEESSITNPNLAWQNQIDCAMGYDYGSGCDFGAHPTVRGFAQQVTYGTWQLRHDYECAAGLSGWDGYPCGGFKVGATLGGVVIASKPAASLYSYTPNINTYGPGGSFYTNYTFWFGPLDYQGGYQAVYRFYNLLNGTHFYTASDSEKRTVISKYPTTYRYEGIAYQLSPNNNVPLYRFYKTDGTHFYTADLNERNNIMAKLGYVYKYEGISFYLAN